MVKIVVPDNISTALKYVQATLADAGIDVPGTEARMILMDCAGLSLTDILLSSDRQLKPEQQHRIADVLARRIKREPLSRILGRRGFWTLDLSLSKETLDPRPDSETLIEAVVKYFSAYAKTGLHVLDLGTGTGCLLLSVLSEFKQASGFGIDISRDAIETAQRNAEQNELKERAAFRVQSWEDFEGETFDIVLSNPPYIPDADIEGLDPEVRLYDPHRALSGGEDGMDCYRQLASRLDKWLKPNGLAFFEIGYDQAEKVKEVLAGCGFNVLEVIPDLGGHDRCLVIQRLSPSRST